MGACISINEVAIPQSQTKEEEFYRLCTDTNTPCFSYQHVRKVVKVLRVVDGDTIDIVMSHDNKQVFKHRVRLYGIDTPEKKPLKTNPNREREIEAAKRSTQAMVDKLQENNNMVTILFYKNDKYGRLMGTLYDRNGEDINQWMVKNGYAVSYFGKTKKAYEDSDEEKKTDDV
jgi:micrococcal nuclease